MSNALPEPTLGFGKKMASSRRINSQEGDATAYNTTDYSEKKDLRQFKSYLTTLTPEGTAYPITE